MSNLIRINTALVKANASIQVANKLLSINNNLPELIPYRKGDKWGYCDRNKKIVIECVYDWVDFFYEGFALVWLNGTVNFISNKNETLLTEPVKHGQRFSEGLAFVCGDEQSGFINYEGQYEITDHIDNALDFCDNISIIEKQSNFNPANGSAKTINRNGEILDEWDDLRRKLNYGEGLVLFIDEKSTREYDYYEYYFYSTEGELKLSGSGIFDDVEYIGFYCAMPFKENLAAVRFIKTIDSDYVAATDWFYIDKKGCIKLGPFYSCGSFSGRLSPVLTRNYKWGYINQEGEMIIPPIYYNASNFYDGYALVRKNHETCEYLIIDKLGSILLCIDNLEEKDGFFGEKQECFDEINRWSLLSTRTAYGKCVKYRFHKSIFQYIRSDGNICTLDMSGNKYWEE